MLLLVYLGLGALAGLCAGLFGVGGGIIIVPTLVYTLRWQQVSPEVLTHLAVGTSLATIVVTSLSSIRAHQQRGAVDWAIVRSMTPGIIVGSGLGAVTASVLSGAQLQLGFGCFVLLVAAQMGLGLSTAAHRNMPGPVGTVTAGSIVGWTSALFGIGGGSLTVPFLSWCNVAMQRAVAISAACGLPIALMGSLSYVWQGWGQSELPAWSTGYVYWPAFAGIVLSSSLCAGLGAALAHRLPGAWLKRLFALLMLAVGVKMIVDSGLLFG